MCQAFFVGKIYLVTKAIVTLTGNGQGQEAENLLREQYEFIVSLLYYQKNEHEAALFMVSHPIAQLEMARASHECALTSQEEAFQANAIKLLESQAQSARQQCPGAPECKRSGTTHVHDWKVLGTKDMLHSLMSGWFKETYARIGHKISKKGFRMHVVTFTDHNHFIRSRYVSQDKHGLAFALDKGLDVDQTGIKPLIEQCSNPDELVCHALECIEPVLGDTVVDNDISGFDEQIHGFKSRLAADKARLNNPNGHAALTVLRDIAVKTTAIDEENGEKTECKSENG
jgi:hypothetical protein